MNLRWTSYVVSKLPVYRWKKRKIRAIRSWRSFKVIEVGSNRKTVCDFLLVINTVVTDILSRTVSELLQLIVQILDTLRFWAPFRGLTDNVRCSSWAHWKGRSGLPISVNWTLGVTAESLRVKRDRKLASSLQRGQFYPNFQVEGVTSHQSFCTDS